MSLELKRIENLLDKRNICGISNERVLGFNPIKTVWITLNRSCNFRCPHCYANDVGFKKDLELPIDKVKELVDFSKDIGAKIIILIGGEPFLYKDFFKVIDYIHEKGLISAVASNGYRLSDDKFFQEIEQSPLGSIVFSIKAGNQKLHQEQTKTNSFENIKKAVSNFSKLTSKWNSYTVVLTNEILDDLENIAHLIKDDKSKSLRINFCDPIIESSCEINGNCLLDMQKIINTLIAKYDKIDSILEGRLLIQQSFPKCFWPSEFLKKLEHKNQVTFACHLYNRTGLIFDTKRRLLLCNSIPNFSLGEFGKDFTSADEFKEFFMRKDICDIYKKVFQYTSKSCEICSDYQCCLGGCPLKWFHYSGADIDNFNQRKKKGK